MSGGAWPALVLVEGPPGSGKSTTAQWIAHEMERQGRPARWVYEGEVPHPVLGAGGRPYTAWRDWLADRVSAWARFAAAVRASDATTVVDSTFLQSSVFVTLSRGLDPDVVLAYVDRVADLVRPLDPALVSFVAAEAGAAFRTTCETRGMSWTLLHMAGTEGMTWARERSLRGMDALLAYWREHARVCGAAVPRARLRTLTVEPHVADWSARRRLVAEFVGLPWPTDAAPEVTDLERFAGRYRSDSGRETRLAVRDDTLVMDGLLWPGNRLLPRAPRAFDAEAWPFRLTFETEARGDLVRFRLDGPNLAWGRFAGVYEKLAQGR